MLGLIGVESLTFRPLNSLVSVWIWLREEEPPVRTIFFTLSLNPDNSSSCRAVAMISQTLASMVSARYLYGIS